MLVISVKMFSPKCWLDGTTSQDKTGHLQYGPGQTVH